MIKTVDKIKAELVSNKWQARHRPIELQTENGFSIIRRCDIDKSISASGTEHRFIVRDPDGYELEIAVDIADEAVAEIVRRSRERLSLESSYWINCAERNLATYLWEHGDYPPNAKLTVDYLTPDDLDLARRWEGQVAEDPSKSTQSLLRFESGSHLGAGLFPQALPASQVKPQPIKYVTENGYSIVRLSDIDNSANDTARECRFIVEDPNGRKRDISVGFVDALIALIQSRRRSSPLSLTSKYWLTCAERYLATHLWERDSYPPEGKLTISKLSDDELLLARHWQDQ